MSRSPLNFSIWQSATGHECQSLSAGFLKALLGKLPSRKPPFLYPVSAAGRKSGILESVPPKHPKPQVASGREQTGVTGSRPLTHTMCSQHHLQQPEAAVQVNRNTNSGLWFSVCWDCMCTWVTSQGWLTTEIDPCSALFGRRATLKWTSNNQGKSKLSWEEWTPRSLLPKWKQSPCKNLYKFPLPIRFVSHRELRQDMLFQTYILATEEEGKRMIKSNCKIHAPKSLAMLPRK